MVNGMGAALECAGFLPEDAAFDVAITRYLHTGGTIERAYERLMIASQKLDGEARKALPQGHRTGASSIQPELAGGAMYDLPQGQSEDAPSSQPNGDAENQRPYASNGQNDFVHPSPPNRERAGQSVHAEKANMALPSPVREPSAAQTKADMAMGKLIAVTAFDRELTHTGRRWGNVYYRELDSMREDGDIAVALKTHIGSLRGDARHKTIRELMTPREFSQLVNKTRGSNAA